MKIDFAKIKQYQEYFFAGNWLEKYRSENLQLTETLRRRTDLLLTGQIVFNDAMDMEACSQPYSFKEFKWNSFPESDPEWLFMLSRQGFMLDLALRYKIDEDDRFLLLWKELLFDFIDANGTPNENNQLSWRPLDSGLRLMNWLKSLLYLPIDEMFTESEKIRLNSAFETHCQHAKDTFIEKYNLSNWGVLALSGPAMLSMLSEQTTSDKDLVQWIWQKIDLMMSLQFFADGIHWEQSPLYQHEVVMILANLFQVSEYLEIVLPFDLRGRLTPFVQATYYQANQEDVLNAINDSDEVDFSYVYNYYRLLGFLPDKEKQFESMIFAGSKECAKNPKRLSPVFDEVDSGFLAYKSETTYFTLTNGRHGSSHGHATTGAFTFQYGQQPLLIDSGRYSYTEDPWRIALKKAEAHNTLLAANGATLTEISGSWEYLSLAEPISQRLYETSLGFYANCSWYGDHEQLQVFKRQFIYIEEARALIILDQMIDQDGRLTAAFNYADNYQLVEKSGTEIAVKSGSKEYIHWTSATEMVTNKKKLSKIYNQLSDHDRLVLSKDVSNRESLISVIGEKGLSIQPIKVVQTRSNRTLPGVGGITVTFNSKSWDIYYMNQDIVSGNKLMKSEKNHYIYGNVVVYDENNHLVKIN